MDNINENIVRALSGNESMLDVGHQDKKRSINPRVFIIKSKIDLFKIKEVIKKSIKNWIDLHPLLRCKIIKKIEEIDGESISKRYFAYMKECSILETYENVYFLKYSKINNKLNDCWKLLFENEFSNPFDSQNGPLWRLIFLELNNNGEFKYSVIFNVHHSISDGSNAYEIIKELFKIIEYNNANLPINEKKQELINYECNYPNDPRFIEKTSGLRYVPTDEIATAILVPDQLKPKSKEQYSEINTNNDKFEYENGELFINVVDIIKKRDKHFTRLKYLSFDSNKFKILLKKTKDCNAKLNGCFEVIICLALQKVYRHFLNDPTFKFPQGLLYLVTINIRPFLDIPLEKSVMGSWTSTYDNSVSNNTIDDNDETFWEKSFWSLVKKQTDNLHNFIDKKLFFNKEKAQTLANFYYLFEKGFLMKDITSLFNITNLGNVAASANGSLNKIIIENYYSGLSYADNDYWFLVFNSISSINDCLNWCFCYDGRLIDESVADYWVNSILEIFKLITE